MRFPETFYIPSPVRFLSALVRRGDFPEKRSLAGAFACLMATVFIGSCQSTAPVTQYAIAHQATYAVVSSYNEQAKQDPDNITPLLAQGQEAKGVQLVALPSPRPERYTTTKRDISTNADFLLGLTRQEIKQQIGEPSFVRQDRFGAQWQFRTSKCTLDLFIYDESETGESGIVDYYEVRGEGASDKQACVSYVMRNPSEVRSFQVVRR